VAKYPVTLSELQGHSSFQMPLCVTSETERRAASLWQASLLLLSQTDRATT